jgi:hypothetical protein
MMPKTKSIFNFEITNFKDPYVWSDVRNRVFGLIKDIKKDIGIEESPLEYRESLKSSHAMGRCSGLRNRQLHGYAPGFAF